MSPLEQRMLIYWHIRYFCDKEQRMKDRILFLDTDTMPADIAHAFMFRVEAENLLSSWDLIHCKKYFIEVESANHHIENGEGNTSSLLNTSPFCASKYSWGPEVCRHDEILPSPFSIW